MAHSKEDLILRKIKNLKSILNSFNIILKELTMLPLHYKEQVAEHARVVTEELQELKQTLREELKFKRSGEPYNGLKR